MEALKGALKSKTVWFNVAAAALELTGYLTTILPPGTALIAVNVINIALRAVTSTALKDK